VHSFSWLADCVLWFLHLSRALITAITEVQVTTSSTKPQSYLFLMTFLFCIQNWLITSP